MQRYTAHILMAFTLVGISMTALAPWQEGGFWGELSWQNSVARHDLLAQTAFLIGMTEQLISSGLPGANR